VTGDFLCRNSYNQILSGKRKSPCRLRGCPPFCERGQYAKPQFILLLNKLKIIKNTHWVFRRVLNEKGVIQMRGNHSGNSGFMSYSPVGNISGNSTGGPSFTFGVGRFFGLSEFIVPKYGSAF
jgi:hypothetical protein